ncbi:hypothetical protein Pyn_27688 [Prunus yedoensis var. nudiflora]|uniref:Uncharacterized protein n=1 Tax=Prunus yedoensis var. nudiflora TaxID=2094558 RepID=A0A314UBB2_PRUYE|nr:hypothetical protein Pyn_27688 [Prunus yedoensis var. nudiflora]
MSLQLTWLRIGGEEIAEGGGALVWVSGNRGRRNRRGGSRKWGEGVWMVAAWGSGFGVRGVLWVKNRKEEGSAGVGDGGGEKKSWGGEMGGWRFGG